MSTSVFKNTGIYFLTNLLSQGAVFIFWIIAANILSPAEIGIYALVIFVVDFFGVFAVFGLDSAITRFYYSDEKTEEIFCNSSSIFLFSSIFSIIMLSLCAGFITWLIPNLNVFLTKDIFLFYILVIASSLYTMALIHYAALKKAVWYAKISLSQTVIFFILSILFLFLNFKILGVLYALIISYLISSSIFLFKEMRVFSLNKFFSVKIIKSILGYSLPMFLSAVLGIIVAYFGRLLLTAYTNLSVLGIYSFFLTITLQINALWSIFNRSWTPKIFSMMKEDKKNALEQVKIIAFFSSFFSLLFFAGFIILVKFGFFSLFLKPVYLSNISVLYILFMALIFNGIYTATYPLYYYHKKTHLILIISVIFNIINIILTFFMVRGFGQTGAALSFLFSSIISLSIYLFVFRKIIDIPVKIIQWFIFLSCLVLSGILIFLITSSDILLFVFVAIGAYLAYNVGELDKKKYLLIELVQNFKKIRGSIK